MSPPDEEILTVQPRPKASVPLEVPLDVMDSLRRIAESREMTVEALMKLYVGQGLRQDLARQFSDRVLDLTASVLARHVESEEEIAAILQELREQAAA